MNEEAFRERKISGLIGFFLGACVGALVAIGYYLPSRWESFDVNSDGCPDLIGHTGLGKPYVLIQQPDNNYIPLEEFKAAWEDSSEIRAKRIYAEIQARR